ncbi:hypothetical protein L6V77_35840, partial [Myxococcota bacterium]|nr:hypothetical protein [Myxococcota bacterium]
AGTTTLCDAQPRGKGVSRCDEHCVPTPCDPVPRELCNATDDDGDGRVDEDFECAWGQREVCDPAAGTDRICTTRCTWAPCGKAETCNYQDDDADGKTDEGFTYRWERPPFDVPDVARQGEVARKVELSDCTDDEVLILTTIKFANQQFADGHRAVMMRIGVDGSLRNPPTVICEAGG